MRTYLDYAATTPVDARVFEAMQPYLSEAFGNPSALYQEGQRARRAVRHAREQVAALLHAETEEIFFTSGGSESDNWALKGMAFALRRAGRGAHIVTSAIEHHAVLNAVQWLAGEGFDVTVLPVDEAGRVSPEAVKAAVREDTILVSIMMANNEVGTIEPIAEIGAFLREKGIFFHTDAVQAAGHIPVDVQALHVDALSLSAHKFYGPKGVGALYLRRGWVPDPLVHGGAQERDMRAGTENVPGLVGLGAAAALAAAKMDAEGTRLTTLRQHLADGIAEIPDSWVNGDAVSRLPGNLNFGIEGIDHEPLLIRLDIDGFSVSAGSACSAGSLEPSHVLLAMGQSPARASSAVRVSMGRYTTTEDVDAFLESLRNAVQAMRCQ